MPWGLPETGSTQWPVYTGVVTGVTGVVTAPGGELIGPASGIRYSVNVNMPGGIKGFAGVVPSRLRWPDTVDTVASPPDSMCLAMLYGERMLFYIDEHPYILECPPPEAFQTTFGGAFRA